MRLIMFFQVFQPGERLSAQMTHVILLARMNPHMQLQIVRIRDALLAHGTRDCPIVADLMYHA